jgi:flavoprotein
MYEPLPLFDCVFCVKDSREVVMGLLKHSLRQKYFEQFLEQSINNQIPVKLGKVDMTRYDADAV